MRLSEISRRLDVRSPSCFNYLRGRYLPGRANILNVVVVPTCVSLLDAYVMKTLDVLWGLLRQQRMVLAGERPDRRPSILKNGDVEPGKTVGGKAQHSQAE